MARYQHLPAWRSAMDLTIGLEHAVANFPRTHRCDSGAELRRCAQQILGAVMRCVRARGRRDTVHDRLIPLTEQVKVQLALARELRVFASFQCHVPARARAWASDARQEWQLAACWQPADAARSRFDRPSLRV